MARISATLREKLFDESDRSLIMTPWGIKVQCHKLVRNVFIDACLEAWANVSWKPRRIDSYAPRPIRGSSSPSLHSYALAWDFFATPPHVPPPGGVWTPLNGVTPEFAACFIRRGFTWGKYWARSDVPHIEWAGLPPGPGPVIVTPPSRSDVRPAIDEDDEMALSRGDKGNAVRKLQAAWNVWNRSRAIPSPVTLVEDGDYGPATENAMRVYQHAANLPVTGRADGVTVAFLLSNL